MTTYQPDPADPEGRCKNSGQLPHVHDPWPGYAEKGAQS